MRHDRGALVAILALLVIVPNPSGASQAADPAVSIDRSGTAVGEDMLVTGTGWPKGATLIVELCGQGGIHGSVDCDVANQRTAGVGASGTFATPLTTGKPPSACPCVVKATDQTTHIAATASIAVAGIATVPITEDDPDAVRRIEISALEVTGDRSWTELFGAPSDRVLEVTLVNTGAVAIRRPALSVAWGKGNPPTGFVEVPGLKAMEPGATQKVSVDLPRGALAFGRYRAAVEVQGLAEPERGEVTNSTYPWGLVGVAIVLLQLILLGIRNRLRRRFQRPDAPVDALPETLGLPPGAVAALPAGDEVVDLRDDVEIDLDDPVRRDAVLSNGHTNGQVNGYANGHLTNGAANGHATNGHDVEAERHRESTAALTADLLGAFGSASTGARRQVADLQQLALRSLKQSADLSEALVAAARLRAEEVRATLAEQEAASAQRLAEAIGMLSAARARADELMAEATAAAEVVVATAAADHEARHRLLAIIDDERDELVEAARAAIDRVVSDFDVRTASLAEQVEQQAAGLLAQASEERHVAPTFYDEFDRRLARAVSNAFNGS
jgi:hypothetical protein